VDVDAIVVSGEWVRHVPHGSPLLGRADESTDGRWQLGAVVRGLYLADEPATAVAEWYRWNDDIVGARRGDQTYQRTRKR